MGLPTRTITLTNGHFQDVTGQPLSNGSIRFQLNQDARELTTPFGQVLATEVVTFQLDASGNLIQPALLYSNAALAPQLSSVLLGTFYLVTLYDQNGARINALPMRWIFPNSANTTVDISTMTAVEME